MRNHFFISIMALLLSLVSGKGVCARTWVQLDGSEGKPLTTEVLQSDLNVHKVRMTIHGFYDDRIVIDGTEYHQPYLDMYEWLMYEGEPQLPTLHQTIAIPEGADFKVTITEEKWTDVEIGKIYPAQRGVKDCDPEPPYTIKENTYHQEVYAPFLVTTGKEWNWCNIRGNTVHVCPFRYHPLENRLSVLTDFVLQIDFSECSDYSPVRAQDLRRAIDWHMFDNDVSGFPVKSDIAKTSQDDYDYLIIVGNIPSILNSQALRDFTKWKAFKGYKTKVVSTETTGTTASNIKSYISDEYIHNNIKYVLLIGDYDQIPLNTRYFVTEDSDYAHGDYWYGCLVGGNNDYYAEIPIGRFSTNSLSDFQNMVSKSISYERFYNGNSKNALLVAHKQNPSYSTYYQQCCEDIYNGHNTQLSFTKAYGALGATNNSVLININNNGMNIVNYRGHGDFTSWYEWNNTNENFGSTQINSIDSISVFFNVCCTTGDIRVEPCMMERLKRSSKGAVACLAAVDNIWRFQANYYNLYLFSELLNYSTLQIGKINIKSHIASISYYGSVNNELYFNEAINNAWSFLCGGDPSLEIWTDGPYSIASSDISFSQSNGAIALTVSCLSDYSVALVSESGDYIDKANATGHNCSFSVPSGNFYAVVNYPNYYPYVIFFSSSNYIQNETIYANSYYNYSTTPLNIGYDVTTVVPYGNVVLKPGAKLSIQNGTGGVTFRNGFECETGAELIVQ